MAEAEKKEANLSDKCAADASPNNLMDADKGDTKPPVEKDPIKFSEENADPETVVELIESLFDAGCEAFVVHDFETAAQKFSDAVSHSVYIRGEFAKEGYKLYYYYGRALTEVARKKVEVTSLEPNKGACAIGDEPQENEVLDVAKPPIESNNDDIVERDIPMTDGKDDTSEAADVDETIEADEEDNEDEDDDDGEDDDIKLAWEALEVAGRICDRQEPDAEWRKNKADVLVALGECKIVDESFAQAVEELSDALAIQTEVCEPHDRKLAATLFHLGIATSNMNDFNKAAEWFQKAAEVLQKTIEFKSSEVGNDLERASNINELKQIASEIQDKVQDSLESAISRKEQLEDGKNKVKEMFEQMKAFIPMESGDQNVAVNDISNLVRKAMKRPASEAKNEKDSLGVAFADVHPTSEPSFKEPSGKKPKSNDVQ